MTPLIFYYKTNTHSGKDPVQTIYKNIIFKIILIILISTNEKVKKQ